jgi:hypothetical protein
MTEEQALEILDRAASQAAGTRADHEVITESVKILKSFLEKHKG